MGRTAEAVARDFYALTAADFDQNDPDATGWERLQDLCDEAGEIGGPVCMAAMFNVMEKLDPVDLGSPGPLVHTMERWPGRYEELLADSIRRRPVPLTLWMVNRILNRRPDDADAWLALLHTALDHPAALPATKADAEHFLRYQTRPQP